MMSTVLLPPAIDKLIDERLATGRYHSREEVLASALRQLAYHEELMADLEESAADEAAGRLHDAEDVFAEMTEKYNLPK